MRLVPAVADRQWGVFRADQALAAGWTRHSLLHAVRHGDLEHIRPGVYAKALPQTGDRDADALTALRRRAAAVGLTHDHVAVSAAAAGTLYGLPLLAATTWPCVTAARPLRGRVREAHLHRARLLPGHVRRAGGLVLTSPARTVLDLARESGVDAAIGAADVGVRKNLIREGELDAVLRACAGWPGARSARRLATSIDPAAESVLESISRLRMADATLPAPQTQVNIRVNGRLVGRVDFYWDEFGVVGEADGMAKYDAGPAALRAEKRRQELLEDAGLIVVRWTWAQLWPFDGVAARLRGAFARASHADRAPRRWQTDACHSVRSVG